MLVYIAPIKQITCLKVLLLATLVLDLTRHNIYDSIRVLATSLHAKKQKKATGSIASHSKLAKS